MKCIAVVDSNHSLMNFKLFGERGKGYRIDCDDATAKMVEEEHYTLVEAKDAESMLEWLLSVGSKELPAESMKWLFYYVLLEEDKKDYGTDTFMIENGLFKLPSYQKIDGSFLSAHFENGEKLYFIINGEFRKVEINCNGYTMSVLKHYLENIGELQRFTVICQRDCINGKWQKVDYPVVYKWQSPSPYLVKRYEQDDEMEWHLKSAQIEYGWFVNYQSIITTKGEQIWDNDYTVRATPIREWDMWM